MKGSTLTIRAAVVAQHYGRENGAGNPVALGAEKKLACDIKKFVKTEILRLNAYRERVIGREDFQNSQKSKDHVYTCRLCLNLKK